MRILPGPTRSNQVLAWSPDGRWLVAGGSGDGVTAWDVDALAPGRRVLDRGHGSRLMTFCPASGRLYVPFQSGGFWSWHPGTDEERHHDWGDPYLSFSAMAVSDDGRTVVMRLHRRIEDGRFQAEVVGFAVADGALAEAWAREEGSPYSGPFTFRRGSGELFRLVEHGNGVMSFEWGSAESGAVAGSFRTPYTTRRVTHWALAPDGARVAWLANDDLFVRCLEDDPEGRQLPGDGAHRRGLAWSPDGRALAYATGTTVRLLDATTLAEVRVLDWNIGKPRAVAFNPDGLRAAASGDGGRGWVAVFDLE